MTAPPRPRSQARPPAGSRCGQGGSRSGALGRGYFCLGRGYFLGCPLFRFSRIFIDTSIGDPAKPNSSRIRRSMNRR